MNFPKTAWQLQRGVAHVVAPLLKLTGWRFSKTWRGNRVVDHIAANILADGGTPFPIADFVWPTKATRAAAPQAAQFVCMVEVDGEQFALYRGVSL
jgi:hypothetical protein